MNPKGCSFLDAGINFEDNKVCDCCISHGNERGLPVLIENYNGELIDWEKLFQIKAKRIEAQKKQTIYECENCYNLTDYVFKQEKKISELHFSHCRICSAKCIYCNEKQGNSGIKYDVYPVIKDLIDKGYYKSGGEATLQGGEPTMMIHFDELVDLLSSGGTKLKFHSNAIKFSETINKTLKNNDAKLVVSIDSSCKETYKKIKQVDEFDKVCENIKSYRVSAKPENLIIKYLIVPGFNDNPLEIKNFFELMNALNIKTVALDLESLYARVYEYKNISPHIYFLTDYFQSLAKAYKFDLKIYSFLFYVLQNRSVPKAKYLKNFEKFEEFIDDNTQYYKNIEYKR